MKINKKQAIRFFFKISFMPNGCWEWKASRNKDGYGQFYVHPQVVLSHRVSWIIEKGKIPKGKHVLHKCDNPPCVNPDHLFIGTHSDNIKDAYKKGRLKPKCGSIHINSKLTEKTAMQLLRYVANGNSIKDASIKFKISYSVADNVCHGRRWITALSKFKQYKKLLNKINEPRTSDGVEDGK